MSWWDPCYIAGWSAANHWALTDQVFRSTVVATAQRVRRVDQELAGASYLVRHVGADRLEWGLVGEWRGDRKVQVSGRERTVADMLSDPTLGGGIRHTMEVLDTLLSVTRLEDLVGAVERLDNGRRGRLGGPVGHARRLQRGRGRRVARLRPRGIR